MTAAIGTDSRTAAAFVPSGHPVRRFAGAMVLVGGLAITAWLGGLAHPRLDWRSYSGVIDPAARTGEVHVGIANVAFMASDIRSATIDAPGITTDSVEIDGIPLDRPLAIDRVDEHVIGIRYHYGDDCFPDTTASLRLVVETPLGIDKVVHMDDAFGGVSGQLCPPVP